MKEIQGKTMKIQANEIDFECPCCADPYSQCPYNSNKKSKEIDWDHIFDIAPFLFTLFVLLSLSFAVFLAYINAAPAL